MFSCPQLHSIKKKKFYFCQKFAKNIIYLFIQRYKYILSAPSVLLLLLGPSGLVTGFIIAIHPSLASYEIGTALHMRSITSNNFFLLVSCELEFNSNLTFGCFFFFFFFSTILADFSS
jgi:hypothetical protein